MKYTLSILLSFFLITSVMGQSMYKRKNRDLIPLSGTATMSGWHFAPGLTYMLPTKLIYESESGDQKENVDDNGRLSVYLELGRYHVFPGGGNVFNYMDYSLAFKRLSGKEEFYGDKGVFKHNYLLGNFNLNNIWQINDYNFLQNSIGVNVDYMLFEKHTELGGLGMEPNRLLAQLHYKIGWGIKATDRMFVIPSIETPILTGYTWDDWKSTHTIFNSRYRPFIFSVRFAWISKAKGRDCPPVYDPASGNSEDKKYIPMN